MDRAKRGNVLGVASLIATAVSATLLLPNAVLGVEALAALLPDRRKRPADQRRPRVAILIPAHDEEGGIGKTVSGLLAEITDGDRIIVIADNCSDHTADVARAAGAEVIERTDPDRRGKGHALSFGANHLRASPPEVVIIMDADCRVERGTLRQLAELAAYRDRPVQAVYLMHAVDRRGMSGVSAFAFLVRNLVRPTGLARLGLPSQLTGTGMAFPWHVYRDAPATEGFLVEDLLLGHELALRGKAPLLCEDVIVGSDFPTSEQASLKQRRRWEHGELAILLRTPRLIARGISSLDPGLIALALDSAVPPLALLVVLQTTATGGAVVLALLGGSWVPVALTLTGGGLLTLGLGAAWLAHGRELLSLSDLAKIPSYVLWKLPLYSSFMRRGMHSEWERTERA
jgi:cellulose synthase/poly-beta-1,6-N-acetylglucosamine synthase-like glycosyltransferase